MTLEAPPLLDAVTAYADGVVNAGKGEAAPVVGRLVRLACERHLRDLDRTDIHFDEEAAARAIGFFGHLTLSGGNEGDKPFKLQGWQQFIVGSLFGWKRDDGLRRFRVAYVEAGKGSGKSPLAAGIGLFMLIADGEDRAEVYAGAVDRDQAQILFRDAVQMVNRSPALDERLTRSGGPGKEWNLGYIDTGSFFATMSSEHTAGRGKSGFRVHCGLLDEIHEHPSDVMVELMRANAKGAQPLIFEITNSGSDRSSVCYQHHDLSARILEGQVENDAWFAYVCGLDLCDACRIEGKPSPEGDCDDCDDWRDESVWLKANPNLDVSISRRYLRELVAEAVAMPSKENIVKRLNFCIWTTLATRWITDELWAKGDQDVAEDLARKDCAVGLVVSSTIDISALVLWFPGSKSVIPFFWVPRDRVEDRVIAGVPYDRWAREGHLTLTDGDVIDFGVIRKKMNDLFEVYDIREVITKRWNAAQLQTQLMEDGFQVFQAGDGMKDMSAGCKELERLLMEGELRHGGNPVLRWMMSNVSIRTDAEEHIRPDKETSPDRYDGIEALIIAIGRGLTQPEGSAGVMFV